MITPIFDPIMNNINATQPLTEPKYLWFLVLSYCTVLLLANWFDVRLVQLFSIDTDAGTLIFPLSFLLSDLITEVYGYQQARRAIWCGLLFNMLFILYGQVVIHLPSPQNALLDNRAFDAMMALNTRIILASIISYLCAEPLNALTMAKLKMYFSGRKLALRFVASTCIASAADTTLFVTLAFYGLLSQTTLLQLMLTMWCLKVFIEVMLLPLSLYLTQVLKQYEQRDIYDQMTDFSLFSLSVNYSQQDNRF